MNSNNHSLDIVQGKLWLEIILLVFNDLLGFVFSIGIVTLVRHFFFITKPENLFDPNVIRTSIILVVFSIVVFAIKGLYPGQGRVSVVELKQVFDAIVVAYAIVGVIIFIQGANIAYSRSVFILSGVISIAVISIGRFLVRKYFGKFTWWGEPVVIIGLEAKIKDVTNRLQTCGRLGFRPVIGLAVDTKESKIYRNIWIKPWSEKLQLSVRKSKIKTNILAISTNELREDYPAIYNAIGLSFPKTIFTMNDIYGTMMAQPIDLNGQPALQSRQSLLNPSLRFLKLTIDVITSILIFIPILLIGFVLAILIKLDSPGPVLYTQERIGQNHKPFRLYKFRTMFADSDKILVEMLKYPKIKKEWDRHHKIANDKRITKVGKWIRKFSLDEFAQFINIIRGEMSLIGPRPLVKAEIDKMGEVADLVLWVKPGATGWWQVNGRNNLSFEERTQLDLYYVFNWSFWLDIFIFIKTIWVLLVDRSGM